MTDQLICPACGCDNLNNYYESQWFKCRDCWCEFDQSKRTTLTLTRDEVEGTIRGLGNDFSKSKYPEDLNTLNTELSVWRSLLERFK